MFDSWSGGIAGASNPEAMVISADSHVTATFSPDNILPTIDVWYGPNQTFGDPGLSQTWVNVLGNVTESDQLASLAYRLNGGTPIALSVGPDQRRLQDAGDFNIDIAFASLLSGSNTVEIIATTNSASTVSEVITLYKEESSVFPLAYQIDWDTGFVAARRGSNCRWRMVV